MIESSPLTPRATQDETTIWQRSIRIREERTVYMIWPVDITQENTSDSLWSVYFTSFCLMHVHFPVMIFSGFMSSIRSENVLWGHKDRKHLTNMNLNNLSCVKSVAAFYIHSFSRRFYPKWLTIEEYIKQSIIKRQINTGSARNTKFQALFK